MNWEYNFVSDRNLLTIRGTGNFSVDALEKMILEILSNERWSLGMDCLADYSKLDLSEAGYDSMTETARVHKKYDARIGQSRIAVILGSVADFGLGRMLEMLLGSDVLATVRAFRTGDEARRWLEEG